MIRKVEKNETLAAADLAGKFVFKEGPLVIPGNVSRPHLVTGSSKNRIYLRKAEYDRPARREGRLYVLAPLGEWEEECYWDVKSVVMVCDTFEEAQRVVTAGKKAHDVWTAAVKQLEQRVHGAFLTDIFG